MKSRFYILLVVLILISSLIYIWWEQAGKPANPLDSRPVTFTILRGETARTIAEKLQKEGLIRSSVAFFLITRFGGLGDRLQAGDFKLNPSMNLQTIANTLTHGTTDIWITIPEGWRKEEIALKLAKDLSIPESEFTKEAKEGYMFPDTYLVPKDATAGGLVRIFLDTFNKKLSQKDLDNARKRDLTSDQLIIIASLVEREAKYESDRPVVASIILNRLKLGMKLDLDATVQYALGYQTAQKSWWKKELTQADLEIDSSYNTYNNPGLPPGPISNPGLAAIEAVVNAPQNDYLYYVSDKSGKIHFAKTIEEHNANISKYLNK